MLSSTNEENKCSVEDNICKTLSNLVNLQKAKVRADNVKEKKIIENCTHVLMRRSNIFREAEDRLWNEERRKKKRVSSFRDEDDSTSDDIDNNDDNNDDDDDDDSE